MKPHNRPLADLIAEHRRRYPPLASMALRRHAPQPDGAVTTYTSGHRTVAVWEGRR